ncbi:MAG: DNA-binding protein [Oribacterium sp.]|nr:DNA-binding protein [Oribacterium sp.]
MRKLSMEEKYALSINEAAQYFGLGVKKMRRLTEDNIDTFGVRNGARLLVIRAKFEEFMSNTESL